MCFVHITPPTGVMWSRYISPRDVGTGHIISIIISRPEKSGHDSFNKFFCLFLLKNNNNIINWN